MTRFHGKALLAVVSLALVLAAAPYAEAQRGRGRGGFGRFGTISRVDLVASEQVQAALKLSDEQKAKATEISEQFRDDRRQLMQDSGGDFASVREELQKLASETTDKLMAVLDETQGKRLNEIYLQANGPAVLSDEKVQAALQVTADQKAKLDEVRQANAEAAQEAFQNAQDLSQEERRERFTKMRTEANEKLLAVLTAEQREQFGKMQGEKIELDMTQIPGRGFGRGGGRGQN
jgi:Spy/CpxP family protein refolding chaperone